MAIKHKFIAQVSPATETLATDPAGAKTLIRSRGIEIKDLAGKTVRILESADNHSDTEEKITKAGYVIVEWDGAEAKLNQRPSTGGEKLIIGCLWAALAAVILLFAGCMAIVNGSGNDEENTGSSVMARIACEDMVEDRLKSPGSAEFTDQAETGAGNSWTATGSVDSQNSFGAIVRSTYSCVLTYSPSDETWRGQVSVD